MLFRYSTDPEIEAVHAEVAARSRESILPLFAAEEGAENVAGEGIEMVWVVTTAMNSLWIGFERAQAGEVWEGLRGARAGDRS